MKVLCVIGVCLCLMVSVSSANAAPQAMQRAAKALKAAVVGIAIAATVVSGDVVAENTAKEYTTEIEHDATDQEHTDALASHEDHDDATRKDFTWFGNYFGVKPDIPKSDIWLTVTDKNGEGQARLGFATQLLGDEAGNAFIFLRGEGSLDSQDNQPRLPFMQGHVFRFTNSHADDQLPLIVSLFGYEYFDFRADDLNGDVEGFTTHHAHIVGIETPVLSSSIGIAGNFSQADFDYWAGEGADIYYFLSHNGSLGFLWSPHERLEFSVDAKQLRTLGGHINFSDYTEGDFTAIWEEVSLKAALDIYIDQLQLIGNVRFYRQRINANDEFGNSFSSRQNDKKAAVKLQMSFD